MKTLVSPGRKRDKNGIPQKFQESRINVRQKWNPEEIPNRALNVRDTKQKRTIWTVTPNCKTDELQGSRQQRLHLATTCSASHLFHCSNEGCGSLRTHVSFTAWALLTCRLCALGKIGCAPLRNLGLAIFLGRHPEQFARNLAQQLFDIVAIIADSLELGLCDR